MNIQQNYSGNIYLASDFHLGIKGDPNENLEREYKICSWLDEIKEDADLLLLVGDIFDYWFEYKQVIPKGFSHFWGKIRELRDKEIPIIFFTGNHDMWLRNYPTEEYGIPILREPTEFIFNGNKVLVHHGDGLGPGDLGYKFIKKIFSNKLCQFLFGRLHPNFAIWLMRFFSSTSRKMEGDNKFDPSKERLIQYCESNLDSKPFDYYIFGHRHLMIDHLLSNKTSKYINLGDWLNHYSYAAFTKEGFILKKHE